MKTFRPIHDRILIKPTPPDQEIGGFRLDKSDVHEKGEGTVVSVGQGVPLHNIRFDISANTSHEVVLYIAEIVKMIESGRAMKVKPGDYVCYGRIAGTKLTLDGVEHVIVREADVFGVLEDE